MQSSSYCKPSIHENGHEILGVKEINRKHHKWVVFVRLLHNEIGCSNVILVAWAKVYLWFLLTPKGPKAISVTLDKCV